MKKFVVFPSKINGKKPREIRYVVTSWTCLIQREIISEVRPFLVAKKEFPFLYEEERPDVHCLSLLGP